MTARHLLRRLVQVPLTAACIVLAGFVLIHLAPGDPVLLDDGHIELRVEAAKNDIRKRGFAVIRGVFPRSLAEEWNDELGRYIDENNYYEKAQKKGNLDQYFSQLDAARPQIFGIYWSKPQVKARQAESMAIAKRFMNRLWNVSGPDGQEFDPDNDYTYADRTRRRRPGDKTLGLSPHMDSGSFERWTDPAFQKIYAPVFAGRWEDYDPWQAAQRTRTKEYPSPAVCSMFRTFQGWTALSDMAHDQGVLHTVPIPEAMAYLMLRPLLPDVPEDDMCGVTVNQVYPVNEKWHPLLVRAFAGIPDVQAGDSVWWHCDVIHGVAPVENQQGWGNVMYIPAAPWCPRNERYAANVREAFLNGDSPSDFPEEHYERNWPDRFQPEQLNETGRRGLGIS
jgi:hypothetical protein